MKMTDAYERRRESRLRAIQTHLTEALKEAVPDEAGGFRVIYYPIKKYHTTTFGSRDVEVPESQSPAYGFFLVSESQPKAKYPLMHLFRQDVDARVKNDKVKIHYQIPAFKENIREGVAKLAAKGKARKPVEGGLEKSFGIIAICALLLSILSTSFSFTGYAVSNLSKTTFNILGICLFLGGLIGVFLYLREKNNKI